MIILNSKSIWDKFTSKQKMSFDFVAVRLDHDKYYIIKNRFDGVTGEVDGKNFTEYWNKAKELI